MTKNIACDIKDIKLAGEGKLKIEWASQQMQVLETIKKRFAIEKPFQGITIAACLHITSETANLLITLQAGGAKIVACASNPLSTQDSVAAALVKHKNIPVFAVKGEDNQTYFKHLNQVLDYKPNITMDDGGDLIHALHTDRKELLINIIGSSEETTTGVIRLKAMEKKNALKVPVIAVNDSETKHLFDNRYGTGQSTIDGIIRATNVLLAGKVFVVCGYGWCGRGVASRARGMGADVIVTEVDPIKALEAAMDGFTVKTLESAVAHGRADIIVTVTGNKHVITVALMEKMKDGTIIANAGHFDVEIDIDGLEKIKKSKRHLRLSLQEYVLPNENKLYILAEGRLVNLSAAEGHPAEVMDMSFANQALAAEILIKEKGTLTNSVYVLPQAIDSMVAGLKLKAMGISIDTLTQAQKTYLSSWTEGTK